MLSVHRETLAKVPNAKIGRDSLDVNIYGMEGVPAIIIQEKMISKLKKRRQMLQDKLSKNTNLNEKLKPSNILELKSNNKYFEIFRKYTEKMESLAGIKPTIMPVPTYHEGVHNLPPPPSSEESKVKEPERKRDSKFSQIMKEEAKQLISSKPTHSTHYEPPTEDAPTIKPQLNIHASKQKKDVLLFKHKQSPEEMRAQMDKYRYDEKKIMSQLKHLLKKK